MIPTFPYFKSLEITDRSAIDEFTEQLSPYSDFDFTTLWCWDVDGNRGLSLLRDNLIVRFSDYITGSLFYSFLGTNHVDETVHTLFDFALHNDHSTDLRLIPYEVIRKWDEIPEFADVLEDPDHFDYIYSTEQLVLMDGAKYGQARNLLSRFKRRNGRVEVEDINFTDPASGQNVLEINRRWGINKGTDITRETAALRRLIESESAKDAVAFIIRVNGQVAAFAINEVLNDGYAISRFAQANVAYPGLYAFLLQTIAREMLARGCVFLNYEQDLGLPGLRRAKTSYCPAFFLKKYSIVAR